MHQIIVQLLLMINYHILPLK